jgi:AcrR family transcriptional regulator
MRADARRNRESILAAARELFASSSPEVQIDDVARLAGVGVGTVYRHFPDKHALMGALVRERFALFNERFRVALEEGGDAPFDSLADALRDNAASVAGDAATRFAMMSGGEPVFEYVGEEKEEFLRLARRLVLRARRAGELRADFQATDIPMVMCGDRSQRSRLELAPASRAPARRHARGGCRRRGPPSLLVTPVSV